MSVLVRVILLSSLLASPAAAEELSLRVVDVKMAAPGSRGEVEATYTLVNTSPKTITAWDFFCTDPSYGEKSGRGGSGTDAYLAEGLDLDPSRGGLIHPGQTVVKTVDRRGPRGPLKRPYTPEDCAPFLLIYDDATFEGPAEHVDARFQSRAGDAVDAHRAKVFLQNELDRGATITEAVDRLIAADLPGAFEENLIQAKSRNGEAIGFEANRQNPDYFERIGAAPVLEELDRHHRLAVKHVPPNWRQKIAAQIALDLRIDAP